MLRASIIYCFQHNFALLLLDLKMDKFRFFLKQRVRAADFQSPLFIFFSSQKRIRKYVCLNIFLNLCQVYFTINGIRCHFCSLRMSSNELNEEQ